MNGIWGSEPDGENDLAVIRVADFDRKNLSVSTRKLTYRSITESEQQNRRLKPGDLLIEKSGGGEKTLVGCVVVFDKEFDAVTSNFVARIRPKNDVDSVFLKYVFNHLYSGNVNYRSIKQTTGIQNIDSDSYLLNKIAFPPHEEQRLIASKLDSESNRINQLIREKQNFINLLKEKRQALISHVVTKGLDPNVEMKDSGVEWIGEIPKHWTTRKLKYSFESPMLYGANESANDDNPENPRFIRITDMNDDGSLKSHTFKSLPPSVAEPYMLKDGDVLLARSGATVGKSFIYRDSHGSACFAGYLIKASLDKKKMLPDFLYLYTNTHCYWEYIKGSQIQATIQNVSAEKYANMVIPFPPLEEQQEIVKKAYTATDRIKRLQKEVQESIELLKEHRSALISAAVTGKIDLRDKEVA